VDGYKPEVDYNPEPDYVQETHAPSSSYEDTYSSVGGYKPEADYNLEPDYLQETHAPPTSLCRAPTWPPSSCC
jgi:hypothetical protein